MQLGNVGVISSIRSLEPYAISWSNVPDYMHPADFHKLAQAVSAPEDTVHFMHRYRTQILRLTVDASMQTVELSGV